MRLVKGKSMTEQARPEQLRREGLPPTKEVERKLDQALLKLNFSSGELPCMRFFDIACLLRVAAETLESAPNPKEERLALGILKLLWGCYETARDALLDRE